MPKIKVAGLSPLNLLKSSVTINHSAKTDMAHHIKELRTPIFKFSKDRIFHEAVEAASNLKRWKIAEADFQRGYILAEARTRTRFVDDVEITVSEDLTGGFKVEVSSKSRKGISDLGQNTRNIAKFLNELKQRLG